ncbi:MAG: MarR family transcriptional regulator [Nocardiopsaceae bacterium]|nr:MarR family transcriptional regulator [Nocardiopsaceae bacterium]
MEASPDALAGDLGPALERVVALIRSLNTNHVMSRSASGTLATLERGGPSRLTALATREGVTQPAMTQLISRLESAGLVRREPDPGDGRVVRVTITEAGRSTMALRRAERTERLTVLLAQLSVEQRTTLAAAIPALDALAGALLGPAQPIPG